MEASDSSPEILSWLRTLPLAPEYHPSLSEFQDPISYILKIENEASQFGICKIVPPLPRPPKKTAVSNLNHSLSSRNPNPKRSPTFTTRQQQIGFCPRKQRPVKKPVWQSGESYTLQQFEAKAKHFEKTQLRKSGKKSLSALEIETLFWRACADKPFSVEYANDIPGSAFAPPKRKCRENGETLGETAWNMRGVSRGKGSLLRFMKEEIPGVTSPMVYVAMMFSWFAWHAEDHDLHSLNYLHFGAGKTWYGVPKDAAMAFEEVVRLYGYGGEVNPLATFAILGEKTTVMSPQVLIDAGVPCCRLVQNAGEFVVTFPRAYHSGFSHGFNCGEAANIATPEWLRVAKEAAVRRASINYPPLVSHLQLLYALALTLCSRVPTAISLEPRSSRLKGKKRVEGEMKVKQHFVQSVIQNNDLLHILREKGSSCILLPQNSSNISLSSNSRTALKYQRKVKPRLSLGLCSPEEAMEASEILLSDDIMPDRNPRLRNQSGLWSARGESVSLLCDGKRVSFGNTDLYTSTSLPNDRNTEEDSTFQGDGFLDQGLFSCVTCGILSFACVAVIQPREEAARYLMSVDCSFLNDQTVGIDLNCNRKVDSYELDSLSGQVEDNYRLVDVPVQASDFQLQLISEKIRPAFDAINSKGLSALDLLASVYADSSDSEGEAIQPEIYRSPDKNGSLNRSFSPGLCSSSGFSSENTELPPNGPYHQNNVEVPISMDLSNLQGTYRTQTAVPMALSPSGKAVSKESVAPYCSHIQTRKLHRCDAKTGYSEMDTKDLFGKNNLTASEQSTVIPYMQGSHRDSSRMHIFCLEHAVEVERQLHTIGGVEMLLLCHPDYPKFEAQSKSLAEEMGINYCWKDIIFREPSPGDEAKIRTALDDEAAIPGNGDWAVKLGINLYYSSTLSRSPLYSKQMPYNPIIYKVFGHDSRNNSPRNPKVYSRRHKKLKKLVVAGKWCGKVWMSNQVHPFLACGDAQEHESIQDSPNNSPTGPKVYSRRHKRQKKLVVAGKWCGKVWTSNQDLPYVPYGDAPEHESIKEYQVQSTDWKFNEEPEVEKSFPSVTRGLRKPGRKRMNQFELEEPKNLKRRQVDRHIMAVETSLEKPSSRNERTFGSRSVRCETPEKITEQRISNLKDKINGGPSTRLRRRPPKAEVKAKSEVWSQIRNKTKKAPGGNKNNIKNDANLNDDEAEYQCNIEGCSMGFITRHDLELHKRNRCPIKGCGKKFFSHKYLVQHRRVHLEDRPLKCPWKGCKMSFKWAWARTEHIRVHTGDRPYVCMEAGCGQTFRFVSDFSRHKRKTGHSVKKGRSR